MQMQQSFERPQLPLFDAFLAGASSEPLVADGIAHSEDDQAFSELALRGAAGHGVSIPFSAPSPALAGEGRRFFEQDLRVLFFCGAVNVK